MNIKGKKVLVTGGAGFIGSHLVDLLMEKDCSVRVLDNLSNGKKENLSSHTNKDQFEFFLGSVTDPFDVREAVQDIDVIFHLACLGVRHSIKHPFENHRVNAEGTLLLLEEARKQKTGLFIFCSSSEVYGDTLEVPMTEKTPTKPCTVYGASKLAAEAYARSYYQTYELPTIILRPFNTYGPRSHHEGDSGEFIPRSIVQILNEKNILIFGNGSQTRDFTYVEDTVRAILEAAQTNAAVGKTWNIGSQNEISIKDLGNKMIHLMKAQNSTIDFLEARPGDLPRLCANSEPFRALTGWSQRIDLEEGLLRTIDWFRQRPEKADLLLQQEVTFNWK